jgi:hypothetical protein
MFSRPSIGVLSYVYIKYLVFGLYVSSGFPKKLENTKFGKLDLYSE